MSVRQFSQITIEEHTTTVMPTGSSALAARWSSTTGRSTTILSRRVWSAFGRLGSLDQAMSHYDREANIAALNLKGFDGGQVFGENHEWGLLPAELLDALPEPVVRDQVVIERQPA
jgi:hypothetical protein